MNILKFQDFVSLYTPFGTGENRTSRVSSFEISLSIGFEIIPEGGATFLGP